MKLLLISNSTNAGEPYLQYPLPEIARFLKGVREVVFVPYAAVTFSYAEYERRVAARFAELGIRLRSVHRAADAAHMIRHAEAVCVGGGNTFALTKKMQEQGLMKALLARIRGGMPYVGWSAGSNVCCPTIRTTNDMPIVEPESFRAIGAVKFQINPHYLDANPDGHAGETREQRILEFIEANPRRWVVGLREGCMLHLDGDRLELIGPRPMRIFPTGVVPCAVLGGYDLSFRRSFRAAVLSGGGAFRRRPPATLFRPLRRGAKPCPKARGAKRPRERVRRVRCCAAVVRPGVRRGRRAPETGPAGRRRRRPARGAGARMPRRSGCAVRDSSCSTATGVRDATSWTSWRSATASCTSRR